MIICVRWLHKGDVTRVCWLLLSEQGNIWRTTGIRKRATEFFGASTLAERWQRKLKGSALVYVNAGL